MPEALRAKRFADHFVLVDVLLAFAVYICLLTGRLHWRLQSFFYCGYIISSARAAHLTVAFFSARQLRSLGGAGAQAAHKFI